MALIYLRIISIIWDAVFCCNNKDHNLWSHQQNNNFYHSKYRWENIFSKKILDKI